MKFDDIEEEMRKFTEGFAYKPKQKWISVKERLPSDMTDVLVYASSKKGQAIAELEKYCAVDRLIDHLDGKGFRTDLFGYGIVTHWMKLPEDPQ